MWLIQREVQKIYMWKEPYTDYSAMQWPCPTGFHVPSYTEWENVINVWTTLWIWSSSNTTPFLTYLKVPLAWQRGSDMNIYFVNQRACLMSSSFSDSVWFGYYTIVIPNSTLSSWAQTWIGNINWQIRPFKDEVVTPDSSRTVLYQWTWDAWIYWSSALWLISLSSNWQTWITIADKNLWATTVYNYWDTLTIQNTWNMYQMGNNYWFPSTLNSSATISSSTTTVNASGYWPWNYYSSSTFIKNSVWENSGNADLRWWISWIIPWKDIQIRPEEWKPSSDVIAYFPLDSKYQLNSYDWTKSLTASGNWYSISDNCVTFTNTTSYLYVNLTQPSGVPYTYFWWVYVWDSNSSIWYQNNTTIWSSWRYGLLLKATTTPNIMLDYYSGSSYDWVVSLFNQQKWWHSIVVTSWSSTTELYLDGALAWNKTTQYSITTSPYIVLNWLRKAQNAKYSKVWLSSTKWTAADALDFYNKTKSDFWL